MFDGLSDTATTNRNRCFRGQTTLLAMPTPPALPTETCTNNAATMNELSPSQVIHLLSNNSILRVIRLWIGQQHLQGKQSSFQSEGRAPLVLQNVETNCPILTADVWVPARIQDTIKIGPKVLIKPFATTCGATLNKTNYARANGTWAD